MAKKKNKKLDFQKTKLKVGKKLPKGGNITDTSFKTKQIITPNQTVVPLADKSLQTILNFLDTNCVKQKVQTLKKIRTYIADHKESLSLYFPDILTKLANAAKDSDDAVPPLAVEVIVNCLKLLTHAQYKTFSRTMNLHLNSMMTHWSLTVKQASLKVLEALLDTYPKVVTQEPEILFKLLNMVSSLDKQGVRRLDDLVNPKMTSYDWHQEVLKLVCLFLRVTMEPKDDDKEEEEDDGDAKKGPSEVYWDGKTELYLPLYSARGPVKVDMSWYASTLKRDDGQFTQFVFELLNLLSDVVKGELPLASRMNQVILKKTDVMYLNLIVQILCYAGEFAQQKLKLEPDEFKKLSKRMQDIIFLQLFHGFPYAQHRNVIAPKHGNRTKEGSSFAAEHGNGTFEASSFADEHGNGTKEEMCADKTDDKEIQADNTHQQKAQPVCLHLNMGICYLSAMFLLETEATNLSDVRAAVVDYLEVTLKNAKLSDRSLLLGLKTSRILMKSKYVNIFFKTTVMGSIYGILEVAWLTVQCDMLFSFFVDLSLDDNYRDIFPSKGMKSWFESLFVEIGYVMRTGKVNPKSFHYIKQMCCRKYPEFMEVLNHFGTNELIKALSYDNEDLQITVIHMILALDVIPGSVLNKLSDLICQNNAITLKMSIRLIYHLHTRYSKHGATEKDQLLFVKFLLNTACDTKALAAPVNNLEATDDNSLWNTLSGVLDKTSYRIHPTKKWKTHQKIFEVCLELLVAYSNSKTANVGRSLLTFAQTFLESEWESIPVHTVLAFLLIRQEIAYPFQDSDVMTSSYFLIFSSFMYLSVMTHEACDQARLYCVYELQKCLLDIMDAPEVTHLIRSNEKVFSNLVIHEFFYALKVIMFLNIRGKIDPLDPYIRNFFNMISGVCSSTPMLKPVWDKICYS